jgi:hypothetical protein
MDTGGAGRSTQGYVSGSVEEMEVKGSLTDVKAE